jgi:hypothetical protein
MLIAQANQHQHPEIVNYCLPNAIGDHRPQQNPLHFIVKCSLKLTTLKHDINRGLGNSPYASPINTQSACTPTADTHTHTHTHTPIPHRTIAAARLSHLQRSWGKQNAHFQTYAHGMTRKACHNISFTKKPSQESNYTMYNTKE